MINNTSGSRAMVGPGDAVWILTSAFIIFTMISGFGLVESGKSAIYLIIHKDSCMSLKMNKLNAVKTSFHNRHGRIVIY